MGPVPWGKSLHEHTYAILCDLYSCKNDKLLNCDIFLTFARNLDCGYWLAQLQLKITKEARSEKV